MTVEYPTSKIIVVDTLQYAGNFEREMCAYLTGQYGECGVGDDLAAEASKEIAHIAWWSANIRREADENGCRRPAAIWVTPGWFNYGIGELYPDDPAVYAEAKAAAAEALRQYHALQNDIVRTRLANNDFDTNPNGWTKEGCERTLASNEASVQRILDGDTRYPANLSVAIFVNEIPPEEVLEEMKLRAQHFCDNYGQIACRNFTHLEKIDLTGFRMIEPRYELAARSL